MDESKDLISKILKITKRKKIGLHEPFFDKKDYLEVSRCVKSSFVSTYGQNVIKFEREIKKLTKSKFVIATNSGTSALHIALKASGVEANSNVILPTLSFVATANSIIYNNANPIFLDSNNDNFGLCENSLLDFLNTHTYLYKKKCYFKKNKKIISALIVANIFGSMSNIEKILKISKKFSIPLIEDSAESVGCNYKGKHLGTFGSAGILSFNGNKIITSGSGGAILTNSKKIYQKAKHLCSVSKIPHKWNFLHDQLGWNYKINSLNAALGISQIKKLNQILLKKKKIKRNYQQVFYKNKYFDFIDYDKKKKFKSNYWLNVIKIRSKKNIRNKILDDLNMFGLQCRPVWKLLHTLPFYKKYYSHKIKNSYLLEKKLILIPSGPNIIR